MFEKSDQQFANAAKHKAVRRQLLASLKERRKHSRFSRILLTVVSLLQVLLLFFMFQVSDRPSLDVLGLFGLALVFSVSGAVSETSRFYALDTQIKVIRMMEVANGQAEAEPLSMSFNT